MYSLANAIKIVLNFVIGKPDDFDANANEELRARSVISKPLIGAMLIPVKFDHKARLGAVEIREVDPEGMLAPEGETFDLRAPQT
jgi:hypothetical protein